MRYHTTELVQQELNKYGINTTVRIPSDLYPIEHVWSWLSGEIANAEVVDEHDLINQAEAVWNDLTVIMCNNYITHMNTVTQTIVDAMITIVVSLQRYVHCKTDRYLWSRPSITHCHTFMVH